MAELEGFTGALYTKMSEDLQLTGKARRTHDRYLRGVRKLAEYFHTPPDQISEQQLRTYFLRLRNELYSLELCLDEGLHLQVGDETHVTFTMTPSGTKRSMTKRVTRSEFVRGFVQYVLPPVFHRIRSSKTKFDARFGYLTNAMDGSVMQ